MWRARGRWRPRDAKSVHGQRAPGQRHGRQGRRRLHGGGRLAGPVPSHALRAAPYAPPPGLPGAAGLPADPPGRGGRVPPRGCGRSPSRTARRHRRRRRRTPPERPVPCRAPRPAAASPSSPQSGVSSATSGTATAVATVQRGPCAQAQRLLRWPGPLRRSRGPRERRVLPLHAARARGRSRQRRCSQGHVVSVDRQAGPAAAHVRQDVRVHAGHRVPHNGRARRWARVHNARLLLARMRAQGPAVQGQVQAGQPYSCTHRRETVSVPVPGMRQGVCPLREPQDTQAHPHRYVHSIYFNPTSTMTPVLWCTHMAFDPLIFFWCYKCPFEL